MRIFTIPATAVFATLLTSCGVTLDAKRIIATDTNYTTTSVIPGDGIVYALPKTQLEIYQPLKLTIRTSGIIQGVFDECRRACDATGSENIADACAISTEAKLKFLPPELRTVSIPDHSRLYQVSPAADIFQTMDFKYEIASNGVIDKADMSGSNMAYELATSLATTAVKLIGAATPIMAANLKSVKTAQQRNCYQVSTDVATLAKNDNGILTCTLAKEVETCMAPFDNTISNEHIALNALFNKASATKTDPKLLTLIAANQRERINVAVAKRTEAASLYGLDEGEPKQATYQIVMPLNGPPDFTSYENQIGLNTAVVSGTARILGSSDNAGDYLSILGKKLQADSRVFIVKTKMPEYVQILKNEDGIASGGGFRYRVPMMTQTSLTVYDDQSIKKIIFGPLIDQKIIAQYGPIAALPSKFKGKGGKIIVKIWPDSGGLQTVEIGADAIPTSSATGVIDEAFNQYKSRKDKAETKAAAAALVDSEMDTLTRQQKILSLKKQIRDLEDSFKN